MLGMVRMIDMTMILVNGLVFESILRAVNVHMDDDFIFYNYDIDYLLEVCQFPESTQDHR